jgi:hypothetical protein
MNYYERIIREGSMAADDYIEKKNNIIEGLNVTEQELEDLYMDALMVIEGLGDPFDPFK